jgi:hypothetical protein
MELDSISGAMIMYENAKYIKNPITNEVCGIGVDINGVESVVPISEHNLDYQTIMQLVAEGKLVIAPADA